MQRNCQMESLEGRTYFAVTASFLPGAGTLSVFGDSLNNQITVSRNAAGQILVNGGAVAVLGGTPTVANTALVQVFGQVRLWIAKAVSVIELSFQLSTRRLLLPLPVTT